MQEAASAKSRSQNSGKFIDTLISQWMKRTGSNVSLNQTEEVACSSTQNKLEDTQQILQDQERIIKDLKRKLKDSQQVEASLSASLEIEARNKEEIQTKLNATWDSVETITEYFNYISESLTSFQQHCASLSAMYNNVIQKQQEAIQQLQLSNIKSKDLENHVAQLENKSLLQEKRFQEAIAEAETLRKQLENSEHKLQLQRNELARCHSEKLMLVDEQQRLLSKYENSQSRLQTVEEEKCNIMKSIAQLENTLHLEEEKMQTALTEQNKLQKQLENSKHELQLQKNELMEQNELRKQLENFEHELQLQKKELMNSCNEKICLSMEKEQLESQYENLQSRLQTVEKEKSDIAKLATELESKLQLQEEEVQKASMEQIKLHNQIDDIKREFHSQKNDLTSAHAKEKEILIKEKEQLLSKLESFQLQLKMLQKDKSNTTEVIAHKDAYLSKLESDVYMYKNQIDAMRTNNKEAHTKCQALAEKQNVCEKELREKTEKIQNLEATLSLIQRDLERTKIDNEIANIKQQQQLKTLQEEKMEALKREGIRIQENQQLLSKLESLQSQLILQKDNSHKKYNEDLQDKLKEVSQKSNENQKPKFTKAQKNVNRKKEVRFDSEITENPEKNQNPQEAEINSSTERKFFKSGPPFRHFKG